MAWLSYIWLLRYWDNKDPHPNPRHLPSSKELHHCLHNLSLMMGQYLLKKRGEKLSGPKALSLVIDQSILLISSTNIVPINSLFSWSVTWLRRSGRVKESSLPTLADHLDLKKEQTLARRFHHYSFIARYYLWLPRFDFYDTNDSDLIKEYGVIVPLPDPLDPWLLPP